MRLTSFLLITALSCAALAPGSTQPGQLVSATLPASSTPLPLIRVSKLDATTSEDRHDVFMNHLWITSMAAMVAASSADAATSWGKQEGNGLLASGNGTFGVRGVSIKAAMAAAVLVPQMILVRHHKSLRGKFIVGNFAEAGIFTGVSIHNLHVTASSN